MSVLKPSDKQTLDQERSEVLQQWDAWLEMPLLVLGFAWLGLFIIELIWGLNPLLVAIGITIWLIFVVDFGVKFLLAPRKLPYLKHNWLIVFSLLIPALRTFRIVGVIQSLPSVHVVRGLHLLGVMARTNRGMRLLAASVQRRGVGYVVGLTAIVLFVGTIGIYAFEHKLSASVVAQSGNVPTGITDYGMALWWTAMMMTTIGSDYFPKTAEGRVLCFLLALYAIAVCGYATATLAIFFIDQDAESDNAALAGEKSIQALQAEIAALRVEIQALVRQNLDQ
jgi:voltage-gated potassium channel